MAPGGRVARPRMVGRDDEQRLLRQSLERAAAGTPCAIVVHGEAGVGKTRLVRQVLDDEAERTGTTALWGTCVDFGASALPFAPFLTALRDELPDDYDVAEPFRLVSLIDVTVDRALARGPVALVVDDLQWADASSLDALAFLIAGFRPGRRLTVLATCREEQRPDGHPLHGWLADMRRMSSFSERTLGRLDVEQTATLLAQLHGGPADLGLAAQVHARADGNPYLTELLAAEISPGARDLPAAAPDRLRDALTATWHRLDPEARQVTRLLAVGGRPLDSEVLRAVAEALGIPVSSVAPALDRARVQGVVTPHVRGRFWFRHPVLAEVLTEAAPPDETAAWHAAFAEVLESRPGCAPADLAVHHALGGHPTEAFRWSLEAADAAAAVNASAEEAEHLVRACALWPHEAPERAGSRAERADLLARASRACRLVIRYDDAQRLLEQARSLVDEEQEPLLASELTSDWCQVTWERSGPGTSVVRERHDALRLTDGHRDSAARARALEGLALAEFWDGREESARAHALEALRIARATGSDLAIARALNACFPVHPGPARERRESVEEALRRARACGATDEILLATIWLMNSGGDDLRLEESVRAGQRAFADALDRGGPHWGYFVAAFAAEDLLLLGRFDEAFDLLREALAVRSVGVPGALTRLAATKHAVRTGDVGAAGKHLERALELVEPDFAGLRSDIACTVAEVRFAEGNPEAALAWVEERLMDGRGRSEAPFEHKTVAWLTRALADVAQAARDGRHLSAERRAVERLDHWLEVVGSTDASALRADSALQLSAWDDLHHLLATAEVARCRRTREESTHWERLVTRCRADGLRWYEAYGLLRLGQAMIGEHGTRSETSLALRRLHHLATSMGAVPLREEAEALARAARISLVEPALVPPTRPTAPDGVRASSELTAREREVLGHLVAGRTNAEVAQSLVISEKTVSVHVSNILRKTDTTSRAAAAAWARRLL